MGSKMAGEFKACSVDGCNRNASWGARGRSGYCRSHYERIAKYGDPNGGEKGKCQRWMAAHLAFEGDECLTWPFARTKQGYGDTAFRGGHTLAHRAMCTLAHGEPPADNLDAAHACGNGHLGCVNPRHLRWDTRSGNFADKLLHGTDNRGEKSPVAKLTREQVDYIRAMRGVVSQSKLGEELGISQSNVCKIQKGVSWGH